MAPNEHGLVGARFWDRFEAFRGGSGPFEERVPLVEKPTELQGKRSAERFCRLASPEPTASWNRGGATDGKGSGREKLENGLN
jgi:hypothetical protein